MSKYFHPTYITSTKKGSVLWRSLNKGWNMLNKNIAWNTGSGSEICFWGDNWVDVRSPRSYGSDPLEKHELKLKVSDMCVEGRGTFGL